MSESNKIRVRIAPSPTGEPHIGTAYIGLFNWLFARSHGGQFIIRIEDTDSTRLVPGADIRILNILKWLGLNWDEGPDIGGPHAPYTQSQRNHIYSQYVEPLLNSGKAYRCFCDKHQLELDKESALYNGYSKRCRSLSCHEIESLLKINTPFVVRLKVPLAGCCVYEDPLRGQVCFDYSDVDDSVLIKSDGSPTYHFANVVDDHLMEITHVIRGEEWLSSLPKHFLLYDAFQWKPPQFFHLALLKTLDGQKLSKRRGNVSIEYYKDIGVLPSALINFLFLIGGGGREQEIMYIDSMLTHFSIYNLNVSSAKFDINKLLWVNQQHITGLTPQAFFQSVIDWKFKDTFTLQLSTMLQTRIQKLSDIVSWSSFLFQDMVPLHDLKGIVNDITTDVAINIINRLIQFISISELEKDVLLPYSKKLAAEVGVSHKQHLVPLIFIIISGSKSSLPIFDSMMLLGRAITLARFNAARNYLENNLCGEL